MTENTNTDKLTHLGGEGELTTNHLGELLDIADLDGDIEIDVENGRASIETISEHSFGLDRFAGENGGTLDALQEPIRLAVQTETGGRSRFMLDIAGFRTERKAELQDLTVKAITRLRTTGGAQKLETMNPFECRVRHDVVVRESFLSESEGAGPHRRVVILSTEEDEVEEAEIEGSGEE